MLRSPRLRTARTPARLLSALALLPLGALGFEKVLDLEPTVVTATATARQLGDAPASVTVISREDLSMRPVQDLEDALRGTPGLQFTGVGMTRRGVSIRGMDSEHTLVLVNGQRINTAAGAVAHADFDLGWVPVEAIERIEVIRGPMSSLYGSEALGGVVNVITRRATDAWHGAAQLNGGVREDGRGGQTHQLGVYAGGPLVPGVLGLSLSGETRRRQETPLHGNATQSEIEGRDAQNGELTLSWTPDTAQRVDFSYANGLEDRWRNTRSAGAAGRDYESSDRIERERFSVAHSGDWSWGRSSLRAYRNTLERTNRYTNGVVPTSPRQELTDDIVDGSLSLPLAGAHLFTFGGEWRKEQLEDGGFTAGEARIIHRALFLQDEIEFDPAWSLVLGNRFDRHEEYGWHNSPRAYLVHHVNDALTIKGGGGRGFKAPSLKQLSPGYSAIGGGGMFTIYGNPALEPEINTTYELSADYRADGWSLTAGLFQNNVRGLIQTVCVSSCGLRGREVRNYENVDKARIRGLELGGGLDLPADLRWDLNYTYLDAIDRSADRRLGDRARHLANTRLQWTPTAAFTAQVRGEYVGSQLTYSSNTASSVPAYSLWHLELSQRITDALSIRGGIENLTDKAFSDTSDNFTFAEPGRTYHLGVSLSF
ncbi:TonB-dependent receptor [Stutzerimonas nosocomialis]|uniref:TonB-dependent receptor n=1 Tax=Stutzerimonas nosocomialis TaxID=1056496 RepID=A0A5R9QFW4_9GAMM|nr:TonB-dependent receptor [Stutzerimonas nosocomialis]TLX54907.1 TonB-dependent receptor [Stutzerimonas nosocomialis]TLX63712.1 TonB-dependent receptor [Stutzerimonas nosocomialis]